MAVTVRALVGAAAALAFFPHAIAARDQGGVISARLRLDRQPAKVLVASITNRHSVPLVSWTFRVGGTTISDTADGAVVRPGDTHRTESTVTPFPDDLTSVVPVFAAFADGSFAGDRAFLERELADREAAVQRAAFLVGVVAAMPLASDAEATRFVRVQRDARATAEGQDLEPLLARMENRPREGQARAAALLQLASFRATLGRATEARDGLIAAIAKTEGPIPIAIALEAIERPRVTAYIENRSQTPIIAWSIAEYPSETSRIRRGGTTYFPCPDPSGSRPGTGYLQPGETRRLSVTTRDDGATFPHFELSMVVFADRRAEGDPIQRDEALAYLSVQTCR